MILGKIANEIYILMSQSINEISEKQTKGQVGSSTMPHKVNPVIILQVIEEAAILRGKASTTIEAGMPLHEGDLRYNKIVDNLIKDSTVLSLKLSLKFNSMLNNLLINSKQMQRNLLNEKDYIASENLMYKLGKYLGRQEAHDLIHLIIKKSIKNNLSAKEQFLNDPIISKYFTTADTEKILNPIKYIGESKKISLKMSKIGIKKANEIHARSTSKNLLIK